MKTRILKTNMKVVLALLVLCVNILYLEVVVAQLTTCPPLREDTGGICSEECSVDEECTNGHKCCYNGCGHVCTHPVSIPYHPPPLSCPVVDDDVAGVCSEECSDDYHCEQGKLCCSNGCGHACTLGVAPDDLCFTVRDQVLNQSLIGSYVPQCEEDGSFSLVQYHASTGYQWCVNGETGEPISELVFATEMLQCNCTYNNQHYVIGDTFPSSDGCNTCFCDLNGGVGCTEMACIDQPVHFSCPAIRESDAGICVEDCESHSECPESQKCCYNGCGYSCMNQVPIPHIPLPVRTDEGCPDPSFVPCAKQLGSCRDPAFACDEDDVCCDNDCSSAICISRIDSSPCLTASEIAEIQNVTMFGSYRPQCDQDGQFRELQCHEHYCWCVNPTSGVPFTDQVPFEKIGALQCSGCVYEGLKKAHQESFQGSDGCNTCTCIGGAVSCTEMYCVTVDVDKTWEWWHTVLVACVVTVSMLIVVVAVLVVSVVVLMRQNNFRHKKLKESASATFEADSDTVQFKSGHKSTELQVPDDFSQEPANA